MGGSMRRLLPPSALAVFLVLFAAGCGGTDDETPVACLNGSSAYLRALENAPGEVRLAGGTPISDCLAENQSAGDLAAVGRATLDAATALNGAARADAGGAANMRLGYLVGAVQAGAEETGGVHSELVRRLAAAATYTPGKQVLGEDFERAYRTGFDAGMAEG
jgi:hypothetical protein